MYPLASDQPQLPYRFDETRVIDTNHGGTITDRPATLPLHVQLRWAVAVVTCPHCHQPHEHPMSRTAGWGHYRAPCNPEHSYYLVPTT